MGFVGNYLANLPSVWLGREPSRPLLFSWYVTHRCELACRYCSDGDGQPFVEDRVRELSAAEAQPLLMPVIRPDGRLVYPCLERKGALVDLRNAGSYAAALQIAQRQAGAMPRCGDECQIFCHMGLSLFQAHPAMALRELRHWSH